MNEAAGPIMFRIRFHGRGGQGIKTASQVLGTAFFLEGFEVQDAPRYGAERRGAPIFAYVRAGRTPIRERGAITRPDLVVVADATLIPVPAAGVLQGLSGRTLMLVNSEEPEDVWKARLNLQGPVLALPAAVEVKERAELPHIGALCAGAAARLTGVIGRERLERALELEIGPHGGTTLEKNLAQALAVFDSMNKHAGRVRGSAGIAATGYERPQWIDVPFDEARISAPDIHGEATSELVKTGVWRTLRPVIDYAHCNRCAWVCSTLCPDGAIRVEQDRTPRIDYDHCKGCMVCTTVCPPHAIAAVSEREARLKEEAA